MRTTVFTTGAALLLLSAGIAAQEAPAGASQSDVRPAAAASSSPEIPLVNQVDFGIRATTYAPDSDKARFQRYRDERDGVTLDRLRYVKETPAYDFHLKADHVGYRDQRFFGSYESYGKVKASLEWNQVPLYYSGTTMTLYDTS